MMGALIGGSPKYDRDPAGWTWALALLFLAAGAWRLTIPSAPYFDEVHYLPAARALLALSHPVNLEHPPLGKELIAAGIALFGDRAFGWRVFPLVLGAVGFFAGMRAMWFASRSRFATVAFGVLLATGFPLLVHARIAMLDGIMAGFALVAAWMCAAGFREPETARWRFAVAGVALGCSMATKWNAVPLAILPAVAFLAIRARVAGWGFLTARRGLPVGGMSAIKALALLGLLPLAVYALTFLPYAFLERDAIGPTGLVDLHWRMLALHEQVVKPHTYQSAWYDWIVNRRAIWYLYEPVDGALRGVMMVGNPLTMLLGLPALVWCAWAGPARKRADAGAVFLLYVLALSVWTIAPKPVQFYYHYLLPSCFLLAALALALDELWKRGWRWPPLLVLAGSIGLFAYFWPILTAAPLGERDAFLRWAWIGSWT